jgi:hypothetical protein
MKQPRNARCACGSGKKYKRCCMPVEHERGQLVKLARRVQMLKDLETAARIRANGGRPVLSCPVMNALALAAHGSRVL